DSVILVSFDRSCCSGQVQPEAWSCAANTSLVILWPPVVGCTLSAKNHVVTSAPLRSPLNGAPGVLLQNNEEPSVTAPLVIALIFVASQAGTVLFTMPYLAGLA